VQMSDSGPLIYQVTEVGEEYYMVSNIHAKGINNTGQVVGFTHDEESYHEESTTRWVWQDGQKPFLPAPCAYRSTA